MGVAHSSLSGAWAAQCSPPGVRVSRGPLGLDSAQAASADPLKEGRGTLSTCLGVPLSREKTDWLTSDPSSSPDAGNGRCRWGSQETLMFTGGNSASRIYTFKVWQRYLKVTRDATG